MSRYKWCVVFVVLTMFTASMWMSFFSSFSSIITYSKNVSLPVIIIDPGHGGIDGGAVGVNNIIEKDINLQISLVLRDFFVINGFEVVMTREKDLSIHDLNIKGVKKQKVSDIHNRLDIINNYQNAILISVHQNKFGDSKSKGSQIFFSPNNSNSQKLAEILQSELIKTLQPENKRVKKKAGTNLYLMTKAKCPAILLECGFLSNNEEAHKLTTSDYQAKIAFTTFCAVMEYLELDQSLATILTIDQTI